MGDTAITNGRLAEPEAWITGQGIADLVSIIVPTWNRADLLIELLEAVEAQSWPLIEVIIVDDGSTDDTQIRLADWTSASRKFPLVILQQANGGPASARNFGMRHCRGGLIYHIDSDDLIYPETISHMAEALIKNRQGYCVARIARSDIDGALMRDGQEVEQQFPEGRLFRNGWMTHAALYRRSVIAAAGPFNEVLRMGEDTEFQWRVMAVAGDGLVLPKVVGVRREHEFGQLSLGETEAEWWWTWVEIMTAFFQWADENGRMSPALGRRMAVSLFVHAIRFGNKGDWPARDKCLSLLGQLANQPVRGARMMALLARSQSRAWLGGAMAVIQGLRLVRRTIGAANLRLH